MPLPGPARGVAGMDFMQRVCACGIAFTLVAFNSHPYILSSGIFCLAFALVLFVHTLIKFGGRIHIAKMTRPALTIYFLWMFLALVSAIATGEPESLLDWLFGYLVPFAMLLSLAATKMRNRDFELIVAAFALGVILRFGLAAAIYVTTVGASSIAAAFDARYNVVVMQPYMDATFGNTGNTGSVIAIAFVILATLFMSQGLRTWLRGLVTVALVLLLANVLMTGSRGAILTMLVCVAVAAVIMKSRWRFVMMAVAVPSVIYAAQAAGNMIISRFSSAISVDYIADRSIRERLDSINIGIDLMLHHPLGIGPGLSHVYNPYSVAHQFAVSQGSELGVIGFLLVLALAIFIIIKTARSRREVVNTPAIAFRMGSLAWLVFAMTTNVPVNTGAAIPWIGLLTISLVFGDFISQEAPVATRAKARGRGPVRRAPGLVPVRQHFLRRR